MSEPNNDGKVFRRILSNIITGFMLVVGLPHFIAMVTLVGGIYRSVQMLSDLPAFTEMSKGFYYYVVM